MNDVEKLLFSLIKYGVSGEIAPDARHAAPQVLAAIRKCKTDLTTSDFTKGTQYDQRTRQKLPFG